MLLSDLKIIHLAGGDNPRRSALKREFETCDVMIVETCLRLFAIGPESAFCMERLNDESEESLADDAYSWLLATGCGLYSQVIGETEIFSQIKEAWRIFDLRNSPSAQLLRPWMQKVFTDVKQVRTEYLQGIGGASYGSLARKILDPCAEARVVLIGAGQLAETVAPYFAKNRLFIWNRSEERINRLRLQLEKHTAAHGIEISTSEEQLHARLNDADHLIICTPVLPELEAFWSNELFGQGKRISILHLGATAPNLAHWSARHDFSSLAHLFALQSEQNELKEMRIRKALAACHAKARQRYLMDAIAINHSWEDLTGFS